MVAYCLILRTRTRQLSSPLHRYAECAYLQDSHQVGRNISTESHGRVTALGKKYWTVWVDEA